MTSSKTAAHHGASAPESPHLFSSPYWYEGFFHLPSDTVLLEIPARQGFVVVGTPYAVALPRLLGERLVAAAGTVITSGWIPTGHVVIDLEVPDSAYQSSVAGDIVVGGAQSDHAIAAEVPLAAGAADEIRGLSGLSVDQLAALFPDRRGEGGRMSRENFHRWLSGRSEPTGANLNRLIALRQLLREARERVADVHIWLLTPDAALGFESPYAVLRRGALTALWPFVAQLPGRRGHTAVTLSAGDRGVRIDESLRGGDADTPASEADESSDWFGE